MSHTATDYRGLRSARTWAFAVCALALTFPSGISAQERFKTPQDAVTALVAAVRSEKPAAIVTVLGRDGRAVADSAIQSPTPRRARRFSRLSTLAISWSPTAKRR